VGYGITAASGYLGASLVYRSGVGVDRSGARWETGEWTPLLAEADLEAGKPQRVEADGVGLVLLRDGDDVLAVGEFCPHLSAPMVDGWLDRGQLVCPWHGSRFDPATGQVVRGPATAPLPCYQTRIRAGSIEVRPATPTALRAATGVGQ
jgi:nitrite reductase/ring-hydroxylating ferredoxin subunit